MRRLWVAAVVGMAAVGAPLLRAQVATGQEPGVNAASLNDTLLAKAAGVYYSTAKVGLQAFDCQVHPDWKGIMSSARHGAAVADDDPKLALVNTAEITLHARLSGVSTLDWHVPGDKSLDKASSDLLERAHRGIENTLLGMLKVWAPLVDGSVAESLGEAGVEIAPSVRGYSVVSRGKERDNAQAVREEFDKGLTLMQMVTVDGGSTVTTVPVFESTAQGLLLTSFVARVQAADEMHVGVEYQTIAGDEVPARITVEMPGVVRMDFRLNGCVVNPAKK